MKIRLFAGLMAVAFAAAGCGGATVDSSSTSTAAPQAGASSAAAGGTVKIAINPWVGYEASANVVAYLLKNELKYNVELPEIKEQLAWEGFETGDVDVIIENWGHPDLKKQFIEEKKTAQEAGSTGNKGIIGWYVPKWMADKYPDITDYKNLNKYADLFKTSESGGKGQLLDGDPSYVTNDEALVKNLKLNFKVVTGGSEAALLKSATQAQEQKKALLFYFWTPHWIFDKVDLVRVNLPAWTEGCDADPKKVACDYPEMDLDKIVSTKFAQTGGKAYELVKNFSWTNEDQNAVANDMTNNGMTGEEAAKKWIEANTAKWQAWIPK
ncbi:ABC transporter substrate-binding protein [Nonomuraea fuscirosea]|jgi:glycine betaine/proline transport system substrate-binding protein|uniref:Glycine betaine/proline transport system substrate-binding protein n=1 Tax=Nonomuraea fuscirosea TaxID=1291556 RepID=A0A2T0MNG3_9ACTN|nr:ABC transporter substrate-binding protein [Nonomuraea fuscirosea]PRX59436.1 glycine betaine/proline transport system substrate-binding protein [Nonomuraea fuscirosea]WSA49681.1 ABC transporter substrate-binding protein [Nonomuraea fuscirosea]